jgi:competence protein ComEC
LAILDVGQGLAVVATKGQSAIVYDVGPAYRTGSAAQRSLVPYLKSKGIEHIEMVVVSHGDDDHSGGLTAVQDEFSIGMLISGQPERLPSLGLAKPCRDGEVINHSWYSAKFYYIPDFEEKTVSANNHSCVVKLSFSGKTLLLMGDVEKKAERRLVRKYNRDLKADILIAGHHGSKNATSRYLLGYVKPEQVIFSAGYKSRFNHPHPDTVQRVASYDAAMFNTAESGAIIITEHADGQWRTYSYREKVDAFWLF